MDPVVISEFDFDQDGERVMKLGVGLTLFFDRPFARHHAGVASLWRKYRALTGDGFTWARLGGGNKSRAVNAAVHRTIDDWFAGKKSYGETCYLRVHEGAMDTMGQYGLDLFGHGKRRASDDGTDIGYLELTLPLDALDGKTGEALTDLVTDVDFSCGVAGLVFQRSPFKFNATIRRIATLVERFEGVEILAGERENHWAAMGLVSFNWLTFVGAKHVKHGGGEKALRALVPKSTRVTALKHGLALRTGDLPRLGDKASGIDELVELRALARALKPLQFVDPEYEFDPFAFDGKRTAKWLTRLTGG